LLGKLLKIILYILLLVILLFLLQDSGCINLKKWFRSDFKEYYCESEIYQGGNPKPIEVKKYCSESLYSFILLSNSINCV